MKEEREREEVRGIQKGKGESNVREGEEESGKK